MNVDGDEADEGDPVQLLQQLGVGTTVEDEALVGVPDEDHPPDEAEEERVVVSCDNNIPWEREEKWKILSRLLVLLFKKLQSDECTDLRLTEHGY